MTESADRLASTVRRLRLELRLLSLVVLVAALLPPGLPAAVVLLLLLAAGKVAVDHLTASPRDNPSTPPESR